MPILLNTPYNPGDHDPGQTYPRAKVINIEILVNKEAILATVEFGDVVSAEWVRGVGSTNLVVEIVDDPDLGSPNDFTTIAAELTLDAENLYDAIKRVLYDYLSTNHASLAGAVE